MLCGGRRSNAQRHGMKQKANTPCRFTSTSRAQTVTSANKVRLYNVNGYNKVHHVVRVGTGWVYAHTV